jgi:hypothetical protein
MYCDAINRCYHLVVFYETQNFHLRIENTGAGQNSDDKDPDIIQPDT